MRSALSQPETGELVVVDDGSRDNTAALVSSLAVQDRRVRCLRPKGAPLGPGAARNLGAQACGSDFLAFLDADDFLLPGAFSTALLRLADTTIDVVLSRISIHFDDVGSRNGRPHEHDPAPLLATQDWLTVLCEGRVGVPVCSALVRRTAFERVNGFDEVLLLGQDLVLWLKLACCSNASLSRGEHPVAVYRRHGSNRSDLSGYMPVQAGVWAFLRAWRWSHSALVAREPGKSLLRGAGLRQRQLVVRAMRGDAAAGTAALSNAFQEPSLVFNRGFWFGSSVFGRSAF